jgi:hypothetical protein
MLLTSNGKKIFELGEDIDCNIDPNGEKYIVADIARVTFSVVWFLDGNMLEEAHHSLLMADGISELLSLVGREAEIVLFQYVSDGVRVDVFLRHMEILGRSVRLSDSVARMLRGD